jgi:uncharacterized protein YsxB (DUF464 family)
MIKIVINKDNIKISGHAGYGVKGNDIVCASVSSIVITSLNAIIRMDENAISYKQDEGFIEVNILKHEKNIDILIENMISMLEELENDYKENIKIDRR